MAINGNHDFFRHAGFFLNPLQQRPKLRIFKAASSNARRIHMGCFIGCKVRHRRVGCAFWLLLVQADYGSVKAQRWQHAVKRCSGNAFAQRPLPHLQQIRPKTSFMDVCAGNGCGHGRPRGRYRRILRHHIWAKQQCAGAHGQSCQYLAMRAHAVICLLHGCILAQRTRPVNCFDLVERLFRLVLRGNSASSKLAIANRTG